MSNYIYLKHKFSVTFINHNPFPSSMKFAHMADVHIGSWRDPKLKELSTEAFIKAVSMALEHNVDFILISGDLFNTALPGIDSLKAVVKELRALRNKKVPVYIIPGSHDFSPSGKTMIDVLEEAGLVKNVVKGSVKDDRLFLNFTIDEKTGCKITGLLGKKGTLERNYYERLDIEHLEQEPGHKIFMFHSAIKELMPNDFGQMDSMELSLLPKNFDYYAGGHVHIVKEFSEADYPLIVYPGPVFPANFSELEKLGVGGFYVYDNGTLIREELNIKNTFLIDIDAEHKSPEEVERAVYDRISGKQFLNTIVMLKVSGRLKNGKASDIQYKEIFEKIYSQGAFFIMKNTSKLLSEEFEEIRIEEKGIEEVEDALIKEHLGQIKTSFDEYSFTKQLMEILASEKHEGEKVHEYDERIKKEADRLLGI